MATIIPSSDLRNKYNEISQFCHNTREPVYLTKNGRSDLVVLSNAEYERLTGENELRRLPDEGLASLKQGGDVPVEEFFAEMRRKYGFGTLQSND